MQNKINQLCSEHRIFLTEKQKDLLTSYSESVVDHFFTKIVLLKKSIVSTETMQTLLNMSDIKDQLYKCLVQYDLVEFIFLVQKSTVENVYSAFCSLLDEFLLVKFISKNNSSYDKIAGIIGKSPGYTEKLILDSNAINMLTILEVQLACNKLELADVNRGVLIDLYNKVHDKEV